MDRFTDCDVDANRDAEHEPHSHADGHKFLDCDKYRFAFMDRFSNSDRDCFPFSDLVERVFSLGTADAHRFAKSHTVRHPVRQ